MITAHLKATVKLLAGTHQKFTYKDVSVRYLQAAGSMALICSGMDNNIISLIGRWKSDKMLLYIHVQD